LWCAIAVDETYSPHSTEDGFGESFSGTNYFVWRVYRDSEPGALRLRSAWIGPSAGGGVYSGAAPSGPAEAFVPPWTDFLTPVQDDQMSQIMDARGWPFLSFWGGFTVRARVKDDVIVYDFVSPMHALVTPRYHNGTFHVEWTRVIPLAPIWTGFAASSLLYALVWFGIFLTIVGPRVFHRSYRHARGCCTACGYQLAGLERCPECGHLQTMPITRRG